jgi:hypothetical protein
VVSVILAFHLLLRNFPYWFAFVRVYYLALVIVNCASLCQICWHGSLRFITSLSIVRKVSDIWFGNQCENYPVGNMLVATLIFVLLPTCAERFSEIWSKSDNIH